MYPAKTALPICLVLRNVPVRVSDLLLIHFYDIVIDKKTGKGYQIISMQCICM
jgi:hypothetical protein